MVTKRSRAICAQAFASSAVVVIGCMVCGKLTFGVLMATALFPAHAAHLEEFPWRGQWADRYLDQRRLTPRETVAQRNPELLGRASAAAGGAKALGIFDEVGIGKVGRDQPVAEVFFLDAPNIAEGAVDEDDGDQRDAVAY